MPKRGEKNVSESGICTCPPSPRAANSRSAAAMSIAVMDSENPWNSGLPWHRPSDAMTLVSPMRSSACIGHGPGIAAILGGPQAAAGRAERETLAGVVDRERMAPHQIVGVAFRQAPAQHLEAVSAVAGSRHHHLGVDRDAPLVLGRRH